MILDDSHSMSKVADAKLAKDKDSWYSAHEIARNFNVKGPALRSWIKKGILKVRNVTYEGKGVHCQLFLIEDNKDFLPPKKIDPTMFHYWPLVLIKNHLPWLCFYKV